LDVERWALDVCFVVCKSKSALLIAGHGSTVNADSSIPTLAHAAEIRRQRIFGDVRCAFWKEEPSLRDSLFTFDPAEIRDVYVVPNFISEGYFTQTVIPRELELEGQVTKRPNGQQWFYCAPVGSNPSVTELLLRRAKEVAPNVDPAQTSLLIVAHGTDLNENSAVAAKREADKIRAQGEYALVLNVYMEEAPRVAEWKELTNTTNVVVVPFFISDGLHSYEDIPVLLGMGPQTISNSGSEPTHRARRTSDSLGKNAGRSRGEVFRQNPYEISGRFLFYGGAIGTEPGFAQIIVQQAMRFDEANQLQSVT
jgi:sirohydrochlorin cobaltochelatase